MFLIEYLKTNMESRHTLWHQIVMEMEFSPHAADGFMSCSRSGAAGEDNF